MALLKNISSKFFNNRPDLSDNAPNMFLNCCEFLPDLPKLKVQGTYPNGVPEGLIVHYTAGNQLQDPKSALDNALRNNYCFFFIDAKGIIYQQFDLNMWGKHAGESLCPVTGRKNVSKYYAGVEIACAGKLAQNENNFVTWFGKEISKDQVREYIGNEAQPASGYYQKFTLQQEQALFKLSMAFIKIFGITPEYILGHDEVSQGRKNDPSGSLSCTMAEFRNELRNKIISSADLGLG